MPKERGAVTRPGLSRRKSPGVYSRFATRPVYCESLASPITSVKNAIRWIALAMVGFCRL